MNDTWKIVLCGATLGAAVGCDDLSSTGTGGASSADTTSVGGGAVSLAEGYKKATWASGVTVTYGDCTIRYQSNGLPNHARDAEYAVPNAGVMVPDATTAHAVADPTVAQAYDVTLSTCPTLQTTATATSLGNIGYMISGASLFNPYEGDGSTVALSSNFSVTDSSGSSAYFVDSCNGHPTPMGQYHYHGLPTCVTSEVDGANGASHIIGIALDGFPVYGNRAIDGAEVTASQLDECNGITSPTPEFPSGVYHYVLPSTTGAASSLRCLKGKVATTSSGGMMPPGGGAMGARESSPCGTGRVLALRDPSPTSRLLAGVSESFRDPWRLF